MDLFGKINDYKSDFTTYGRTFENYKWYKPILVLIIMVILFLICSSIILMLFGLLELYSSPNEILQIILNSLSVISFIPALYFALKIVKDRPFSSYLTLNNSWNWGMFFKSLLITFPVYLIILGIQVLIEGKPISNSFTIVTFLVLLIITPIQCFAEELVDRGLLMQTFGSWFRIPIVAIFLQGLLFSLMHVYNPLGLLNILIVGMCMGFIAWYTQGLEVSTGIHTINNSFTFLLTGLGLNSGSEVLISDFILSILVLFVSILAIILIEKKFKWFGLNTI